MTGKRNSSYERQNERAPYRTETRIDGQLYPRPTMDVFSDDWDSGYGDGFEGRARKTQVNLKVQTTYDEGYDFGVAEKEEVDRAGSSNT